MFKTLGSVPSTKKLTKRDGQVLLVYFLYSFEAGVGGGGGVVCTWWVCMSTLVHVEARG